MPFQNQMGTDRFSDSERLLFDLSDIVADIAGGMPADDGNGVLSCLSFLHAAVQGAFTILGRFDPATGEILVSKEIALPEDFPKRTPFSGRLAYKEFVRDHKALSVHNDLSRTDHAKTDPTLRRFGLQSCLGAPIRCADTIVGFLAVFDDRIREFDETQRRLMRLVAHMISISAERRYYARKLAHKRTNDKVLTAVSAEAISTRDDTFLDFCLKTVGRSFNVDDARILWCDASAPGFYSHTSRWRGDRLVSDHRETYANLTSIPVFREVIEKRKPFLCENVNAIADEATRAFLRRKMVASFLVLPICDEHSIHGMLTMHMHHGRLRWDEEDLETFMAISGIIAQWKEGLAIIRELDERQALINQLFQLSPAAIYQVDLRKMRFTNVNDQVCKATGYSEEELFDMRFDQLLTPASYQLLEQRLKDLERGRPMPDNLEFEVKTKDGHLQWGRFHIRHLYEDGKIWGANVVAHTITEQKKIQKELADHRRRLESLVAERTEELSLANQKLREEVARRKDTERELLAKTERLEEMNTAMRVLLDKRKEDRLQIEENIRVNLVQLIEPYLDRLDRSELTVTQQQLLQVIRTNLDEVIGSPMPELSAKYYIFSPGELQVANLIRKGKTTKETAELLSISTRTVESYRNSIRRKLGLKNKRVNLKTYLSSKE